MRSVLFRLLVVIALAACEPVPARGHPPASADAALGGRPAADAARQAPTSPSAEHGTSPRSVSPWSLCDPGHGPCVGPDLALVPQTQTPYCEPAAGVCVEPQQAAITTDASAHVVPAVLREAYSALADNYVDPARIAPLLQLALEDIRNEVLARGGDPPPLGAVAFGTGRQADWEAFSERYRSLIALVPRAPAQQLAHGAIRAMAASLNDGHTLFLDGRDYAQYQMWLSGSLRYAGIGVRLAGSPPTIFEVFPDSPAERAGLEYGDKISATEGRSTIDVPLDEVVGSIRGEPGTPVWLTVSRPDGTQSDLIVVRQPVQIAFVEARVLDGHVGYIRVRGFPELGIADEVQQALLALRAKKVGAVVLDLRGNGGGLIDAGMRTLSLFLDDRPAYAQVTGVGRVVVRTESGRARSSAGLPLAILVDEATASMGEIFAAAIQDDHAGRVIGAATAGSVAAARMFPLSDGSAVQVTVFRLETPEGRQLNGVGLWPDDLVGRTPLDVRLGRDPPLDAALAYLDAALASLDREWGAHGAGARAPR